MPVQQRARRGPGEQRAERGGAAPGPGDEPPLQPPAQRRAHGQGQPAGHQRHPAAGAPRPPRRPASARRAGPGARIPYTSCSSATSLISMPTTASVSTSTSTGAAGSGRNMAAPTAAPTDAAARDEPRISLSASSSGVSPGNWARSVAWSAHRQPGRHREHLGGQPAASGADPGPAARPARPLRRTSRVAAAWNRRQRDGVTSSASASSPASRATSWVSASWVMTSAARPPGRRLATSPAARRRLPGSPGGAGPGPESSCASATLLRPPYAARAAEPPGYPAWRHLLGRVAARSTRVGPGLVTGGAGCPGSWPAISASGTSAGPRSRPGRTGAGPAAAPDGAPRFVVQRHRARRLHYDLRFEIDGVLVSWAVPRGPTLDPDVRRTAVHVEDHPIEYLDFEGVIPRGEYGGGDVIVWDRGTWEPHATDDPAAAVAAGDFHADLFGREAARPVHPGAAAATATSGCCCTSTTSTRSRAGTRRTTRRRCSAGGPTTRSRPTRSGCGGPTCPPPRRRCHRRRGPRRPTCRPGPTPDELDAPRRAGPRRQPGTCSAGGSS